EHYLGDFLAKTDEEKLADILAKTWNKMSPLGRDEARKLALPAPAPRLLEEGLARLRGGGWARARGSRMPLEFSVSDLIPASAQDIYDAWLSSSGHEKITGGQPAQISAQEGATFTVWNGYISGRNLKLEPGRRIIQSWRTTKFTDADPDSQIEV